MNDSAALPPWPFQEPNNLAVLTTRSIVHGGKPILFVSHDEDDGGWQFLDGTPPQMKDAMVVSLDSIVRRDQSVVALADLPHGWQAERATSVSVWRLTRTMT